MSTDDHMKSAHTAHRRGPAGWRPGMGLLLVLLLTWSAGAAWGQRVIDLNAVNGDARILAEKDSTNLAYSLASGDVNGDGYPDLIVGAPFGDPLGRRNAGKVYILWGSAIRLPSVLDLSTSGPDVAILGASGSVLNTQGDQAGRSVACGDINGDGVGDLIIGSLGADGGDGRTDAGKVYVVYGSQSGLPAQIDLSTTAAALTMTGAAINDYLGGAVASGDLDGDGVDDVIAGARKADGPSRTDAGKVYVMYGRRSGMPAVVDLLTGSADLTLVGWKVNDGLGSAVAIGDLNGDGVQDLAAGAPSADPSDSLSAGQSYVVYGQTGLPAQIDLATTSANVTISGDRGFDLSGGALAFGDFNWDGFADLAVGAYLADPPGRTNAGKVYLIYGNSSLPASISVRTDMATNTIIVGGDPGGEIGWSLTGVNYDGDGFDDLLLGVPFSTAPGGSGAGKTFVINGNLALPAVIDLASVSADLTVLGDDAGDYSGYSVAGGDLNWDGVDELFISAPGADFPGRAEAGEFYVLYGVPPRVVVSIPDTTATYKQALTVPVRVDSTSGAKMVDVRLSIPFDGDLLTLTGVENAGTLLAGWTVGTTLSQGTATPVDTLKITAGSRTNPVSSTGVLLFVDFAVKDVRRATVSPLGPEQVRFNQGRSEWNRVDTGSVTLVGSDGSTAATLVAEPGDTIRIRIADRDLDVDSLVVESYALPVRNTVTGEQETVSLVEQGPADSVFFGAVRTAAGIGPGTDGDGVFTAQRGDLLRALYTDSLTALGPTVVKPDTSYVCVLGDADGNGVAQAQDAARILAHSAGKFVLSGLDSLAANVTLTAPDDPITSFDAALVIKRRLGLIGRFPVQEPNANNHPQPQTSGAAPKDLPRQLRLSLVPQAGYIALVAEDRGGLFCGDLTVEGVHGRVQLSPELAGFEFAFRPTSQGMRLAFAGEAPVAGPGELFRIHSDEGGVASSWRVQGELNGGQLSAGGHGATAGALPGAFRLYANAPNPFNSTTIIRFDLAAASQTRLEVYDLLGQRVRVLLAGHLEAGVHQTAWDGTDDQGAAVASGAYFYRLDSGARVQTKSMLLLK